jgi:hypothetical protein
MNPPRPGYKQKRLVIRKWLLNLRYIDVQDSSTIATDDEKAIERAEGNRRNSEEVHRGNRFPVITEKGKPALGPVRIFRSLLHPAGDGSLGKFKTVPAEFPLDPRRSTGWLLTDHTEDQFLNLLRRLSSPDGPRGTASKPTTPSNHRPASVGETCAGPCQREATSSARSPLAGFCPCPPAFRSRRREAASQSRLQQRH